ncbi:MAG: CoA transferase subunit A [Candidatus Kariarchaeaceae archaeon]|jgi:3-oxoacid CoA-transferase subunit A/glutaconate CoA-transferase subunit A
MDFKILDEGEGELVGWHHPDENRQWILKNKSRALTDKRMDVSQAISNFVIDGDVIAMGGFGHVRASFISIYEMIRQKKRNLTMLGKTAVHDLDVLIGGGCISKVEAAYSFGHELRGLSKCGRNAVESGRVKVVAEISNAGFQWRFLGGMMGVPFIPTRALMGSDTFRKSSSKIVEDPWTKQPICLIPSVNPDVVFLHVNRADIYGNCQIDGIVVEDFELARSARRLIVSTEKIVDNELIRSKPEHTVIPGFLVDAVIEAKYGAHPAHVPGEYFFDEEAIGEWFAMSKTEKGTKEWMDKYVFGVKNFDEYLELMGGQKKMDYLADVEHYKAELKAPWLKNK